MNTKNDRKAYNYYVMFFWDKKLDSGWEYKSDALDRAKEVGQIELVRVVTRKVAEKRCGKLADNANWRNPKKKLEVLVAGPDYKPPAEEEMAL